jgi:hypothetical protein
VVPNLVRALSLAVLMVIFLAGCIKPVAEQTVTATAPFGAASAPNGGPTPSGEVNVVPTQAPLVVVEQFILSRGDRPTNLQIWYDEPRDRDHLQGFSYTNQSGVPCVGFLLTALTNGVWQPNNGALACAQTPDAEAIAAVTFFPTSDGQPYTVVFGRVQNTAVTAIAVVYADGSNQTGNPVGGGFLLLKPGVLAVTRITAIDAQGYTVIDNIPQTPV